MQSSGMNPRAVSCIAGAIMINLTLGTFYSVGNVVPYLVSYMRANGNPGVTYEHGTWIIATFLLGQGIFIIAGSYIEGLYGSRTACVIGCVLHCSATFLTIWAINVNVSTVILTYGFLTGLGCGSAYMASIIAAQKWFPGRKGLFTGVIVAGFGFGGLIFTYLQTIYLNPENKPQDSVTGLFTSDVYNRVPNMFLYSGIIFTFVQSIGCVIAFPPPRVLETHDNEHHDSNPQNTTTTIYSDDILPNITSVSAAFRHRIFYVIGLMMMLVAPGVTLVNSLGKRYGQLFISDDRYLASVVAIAAVANAFGRLTWGYLADKFSFATCFLVKVILFSLLISTFPFEFILGSKVLYFIWMLGLFFGFSGTFVLFPVFIEQVFGSQYHGIVYGILYLLLATSAVLTSFIIQTVIGPALVNSSRPGENNSKSRMVPCWCIAFGYILSFVVFFATTQIKRLDNAIRKRKDAEVSKGKIVGLANRADLLRGGVQDLVAQPTGFSNDMSMRTNEKSLGSIVRIDENPTEAVRLKMFKTK